MKLTISFQNLKHTPSLDKRIEEKSMKLNRLLGEKFHAKWTCHVKDNFHHADVELLGQNSKIHASGKSENMYKTLDIVIAKLEKQIHKKQDRIKNKLHRKNDDLVILDYEQAWTDYDEDYYKDAI